MLKQIWIVLALVMVLCAGCGDTSITPEIKNMQAGLDGQGRLILTFETNLPDGTAVGALIMTPQDRTGLYMAGSFDKSYDPPKVKEGHYTGWFPTASKRGLEAGPYIMLLSLPPNQEAVLGKGNQRLQGLGVRESKLGKGFTFEQRMELPGVVGAEPIVALIEEHCPGFAKYNESLDLIKVYTEPYWPAENFGLPKEAPVTWLEFKVPDDNTLIPDDYHAAGHTLFVGFEKTTPALIFRKDQTIEVFWDRPAPSDGKDLVFLINS